MTESVTMPKWIIGYAILQILTSLVGIYSGYIAPAFFYSQFPDMDFSNPLIMHLAGVWGSKNVGIVIVMIWGLIRKYPSVLGTTFFLKFIADTIDILYTNTMYLPESGFLMNLVTWLILGLPQAFAAYVLFKKSRITL